MATDPSRPSFDDFLRSREVDVREFGSTIEARFARFHRAHPEVYAHLVRLCRQWREAGGGRWSSDAALAVLRWERHLAGIHDEHEEYRLNNDYTSRYARLIMDSEPDLAGIFEVREIRSA